MEAKDIIGLIFTFLLLVLVQFLGRPKKKQGEALKRPPPSPRIEKRKEKHLAGAQAQLPKPVKVHSALHSPKQIPVEKKTKTSLVSSLFSSKRSVRQAVIMQEVLRRPYE